ncbi:uncharacterized protein Pyn_00664 [Prunus yedoensis var. nudiflora]|uniref:EF-hand domain-containing protein n=1 Tax=Prunus yedoensis var. nudiflora TaxID=2094558 RepID=A0A314XG18_PRUYE|nr:uncharacterized protein Pyn_00664 [Prunus yedoensis var. nudiflora]
MEDSPEKKSGGGHVLDGSNIIELVGNKEVFSTFVEHKFEELDRDRDGELSVKELQPAVADIGAALGLPAQGSSPDSDHIYSEVVNEFTHGKQQKVSKTEFKEVLSDILLGMAAGLKRDPIVILRIDGEDLEEFINGPTFEPEMVASYSEIKSADGSGSLRDYIAKALAKLTVEQGMPLHQILGLLAISWNLLCNHALAMIWTSLENDFDGSGIKRLLSNKFELDKTLNAAIENVSKDRSGKLSKEYLRVALDAVGPTAGLPPLGAVEQMDKVVQDAFNLVNADDGKLLKEDEFKKILTEILGSIMLQLEGTPISVYSNSVVHEPLASSSTLLQPSSEL